MSLIIDGVDVVMGGGTDTEFLTGDWTTGIVCGRHAGRITHSTFEIDGVMHKVLPTFGAHQLHGGPDNFGLRHWHHAMIDNGIRFSLVSPDGDQGFPGELQVTADYVLKDNVLSLAMKATTTKPTVINLTNHGYWNLIGGKSAFEHEMSIDADRYVVLNDLLLPSGELRAVAGNQFDFRRPRLVGENYDSCWALTGQARHIAPAASRCAIRHRAARWKCGPRKRACRCTPASTGTANFPESVDHSINTKRSRSSRKISRMHAITRIFQIRFCVQEKHTKTGWSGGSSRNAKFQLAVRNRSARLE